MDMHTTSQKGVKVTQAKDLQQPSRTSKPDPFAMARTLSLGDEVMPVAVGRSVSIAVLAALAVLFGLQASSALGSQARLFHGSFGSACTPESELHGCVHDPYPLAPSESVAVDGSSGSSRGDVYVPDARDHRVEKFDPSGHLILIFGKAVNKVKVEEGKPEAEQNVCLATETCQAGTAASTPGALQSYFLFVAVDSSAGPSAGDVYMAEASLTGPSLARVTKFDENGHLISSWAAAGQLDGGSIPNGPFLDISGVAVDSSGNLWVLDSEGTFGLTSSLSIRASEFKQDSSLITSWNVPGTTNSEDTILPESGLAIDSNGHLYFIEGDGYLAEWDSSGHRIGAITSPLVNPDTGESTTRFEPNGVGIDAATGNIYESAGTIIRRFDAASCHPSANEKLCRTDEAFRSGHLFPRYTFRMGLAVDATTPLDNVYATGGGSETEGEVDAFSIETVPDVITAKASSLTGTSARLNGTVNPSGEPLTKCFFEWAEGEKPYEHEAPCEAPNAAGVGAGSSPVEVHAQISGLTASKTYHFRLVASNANTDTAEEPTRGQDLVFSPPRVLSTSALGVSATSATLQTELNANNVETHYHFEYDTVPYGEGEGPHGTSVPVPDADLGSGGANVIRSQQIYGLAPSTVYYYRVVATSILGAIVGPGGSFTTQSTVYGPALLDGRAWEMVSPPEKSGSLIRGIYAGDPAGVLQASADGGDLAYVAVGPFGQEASGSRSFQESQFLAFRGANGWSTRDISTPREDVIGVNPGSAQGYDAFSEDLSLGAVQPRGTTLLSPRATAPTPYLREADGEYVPLVNAANVFEEGPFDGKLGRNGGTGSDEDEPEIEGGSPDLHTVVLKSCFKLTEDAVSSCSKPLPNLYVWHEGALQLASVVDGKPAGGSSLGQGGLRRHVVSEDGTRLVFSDPVGLYLRDIALAKTVQLDLPEQGAAVGPGGQSSAQFEDMNASGSKVFFTDTERLTKSSNADQSDPDLYMCEVVVQGEILTCALRDLSVARNVGEAGAVRGASLGMDSSGRYIYFAANGALTSDATPGDCDLEGFGTGTCGLYLYDTVTGSMKLVTTLSSADYRDWGDSSGRELSLVAARVSPNGRFVAFTSQRSLTGYDNRDAVSGKPDMEVYLYDRLGDGGEGKLVCASCDPTGARPHGVEIVVDDHSLLDEDKVWRVGTWVAAAIPGWTSYSSQGSLYQSRYLSDSGRLFFDSVDGLVPRDSNGTTDVYEYEPPQGEGQPASNNCSVASPSYGHNSEGCVDLVSSGASPGESEFLDASESGGDVFFLTASQLVPGDVDPALDIYDARVGGVVSEPVKPPACEGDACQNPVSAPEDPTPGSLTFQGPGNLTPALTPPAKKTTKKTVKCKRGFVKNKKGRCVKKSKKKSRAKKSAHTNRRATR